MIEKGTAMVTHLEGAEVHAMNMRDHSMMILPLEEGLSIEAGKKLCGWKHWEDTKSLETTDYSFILQIIVFPKNIRGLLDKVSL